MGRRFNPQRVKSHRIYDVSEVADHFGCHRQTVIRWVKDKGLVAECTQKPWLIRGSDLKSFLGAKREERKITLALHECYCLRCRGAREPDGKLADYQQTHATSGRMTALCPNCGRLMHKQVRRADLEAIRVRIDVTVQSASATLVSPVDPLHNVTFNEEFAPHEKARIR
jgi:hypothetical protein